MLALDQREALRAMLAGDADPSTVSDAQLRAFKREGIATLSPHASAVLVDWPYGLDGVPDDLDPDCALILAADVLVQVPGEPASETYFDDELQPEFVHRVGADALKLLVLWHDGADADRCVAVTNAFLEFCADLELPGVLEPIVRPAPGTEGWRDSAHREQAIVDAAEVLGGCSPALYKAEMPGYQPGDLSGIEAASRRLTGVLDSPWVVLSSGVQRKDFIDAVGRACAGGASGFLAGRAIWADVVDAPDHAAAMRERSVPRLQELQATVTANR